MRKKSKKKKGLFAHLKSLGFTNRLAIYLVFLLSAGLLGGFYLAYRSISFAYLGTLACYTIVFTPIGTAVSLVLGKVVDKSKAENTSADGTGIKYAAAAANNFGQEYEPFSPVEDQIPTI